jgi:Peptidase family M1 domain/Peptidase M1 N-terminal domain
VRWVTGGIGALALAIAIAAPAAADHASAPSLAVAALDSPPSKVAAGADFEVSGTVANSGERRKRARVSAFLRPRSGTGTGKVKVGSVRTRRVATKRDFTIRASVPADLAAADYDLKVCVRKRANHGPRRCRSAPLTVTGEAGGPPNFTPGARTLGDPLLPQIGNGGYDAQHYDISLDYDPVANTFKRAVVTMKATATQDLSELSLDFQDLPVDKVLVNRQAATFSQVAATPALAGGGTQPMKLVVDPAAGIVNGTTFTVEVDYHGTPQVFTDPDGSPEGWIPNPTTCPGAGCSYFVVGEPMGSQAWFPSNNHPSDKASFDTQMTVPTGNTAVGIGELVGQGDNGNGTESWGWSEDSPTSTYLVTASTAATPLPQQYTESSFTEALSGRTLPVYDLVATSAVPAIGGITALTAQDKTMIDSLGQHYGAWPLDSYGSVWDENPDVGYELEVQTKSHFSTAPVAPSTYLHELSHQWWGDSVTLANWSDVWHNEGWAQLSEWIWGQDSATDPTTPQQHFTSTYNGASASDWSIPPATLNGDPANMFANFPTYKRPGMMLEGLREIFTSKVGPTAFDDFARGLQTQFAHSNIDAPQFIAFAERSSGFTGSQLTRLDDYFQQWLYGTTKPTITPATF